MVKVYILKRFSPNEELAFCYWNHREKYQLTLKIRGDRILFACRRGGNNAKRNL